MSKPITIVSGGRAGTTLLMATLVQHPQLNTWAQEPLCFFTEGYEYYHSYILENFYIDTSQHRIINIYDHEALFNQIANVNYMQYVYSQQNLTKILYSHMNQEVTDWLRRQDHLFIHLCRKNMLDGLISLFFLRNNYLNLGKTTIFIDPKIAFPTIRLWLKYANYCDLWFDKRVIKIYYEDLVRFWYYWQVKIQEAAGLEVLDLKLQWQTQPRGNTIDCIENPEIIAQLQEEFGSVIINMDNLE